MGMETVLEFLKNCKTFYFATVEGDQPRVRPFGAISIFDDRLYFCTNRTKLVSKQLKINPKFELCGSTGGEWIRVSGTAVLDTRLAAKLALLEQHPDLRDMYNVTDGIFEVYYIADGFATIQSFIGRNDEIKF